MIFIKKQQYRTSLENEFIRICVGKTPTNKRALTKCLGKLNIYFLIQAI